jgi:hypothetical protein
VVSLLCHSLCLIALLTAVAGAMFGLFMSTSERVAHTAHPRPAIERNDRELRLFMYRKENTDRLRGLWKPTLPQLPAKKRTPEKASTSAKCSLVDTATNDRTTGTRSMTRKSGAGQVAGRVAYFQRVTQAGDNSTRVVSASSC